MEPSSTTPSDQDLAAYWRHALSAGLCNPAAVTGWADEVIARNPDPPEWSIDLAMAPAHDVPRLLEQFCGPSIASEWAVAAFMALVRRRWLGGELSLREAGQLAWELRARDLGRGTPLDWVDVLDADLYDVEQGWRNEAELEPWLRDQLASYTPFEQPFP